MSPQTTQDNPGEFLFTGPGYDGPPLVTGVMPGRGGGGVPTADTVTGDDVNLLVVSGSGDWGGEWWPEGGSGVGGPLLLLPHDPPGDLLSGEIRREVT